jgi:prophage regulatory protein
MNQDKKLEGFLRLPEVLAIIPVSKTAWWEGIKQGRFPKGVKLAPRTTAWRVADIRKYIEDMDNNS